MKETSTVRLSPVKTQLFHFTEPELCRMARAIEESRKFMSRYGSGQLPRHTLYFGYRRFLD